jgi:DNA polymerase beta
MNSSRNKFRKGLLNFFSKLEYPSKMEANAFIADQLKAEASARTGYGASALLAAARIIRTFPTQITNADQLKGIRGVGDGTRRRVKEILAQGARYQVPAPPPGEEKPNRKLANQSAASSSSAKPAGYDFTAIKFIGEVFSRKIHEQGIHTLEELEKGVENGTITLQPNQLAGLKYRVDLAERIPRDEVKEIGDLVLEEVRRQGMRGQITGSYRRGKESSGDVDVLITGEKNQIHRVV